MCVCDWQILYVIRLPCGSGLMWAVCVCLTDTVCNQTAVWLWFNVSCVCVCVCVCVWQILCVIRLPCDSGLMWAVCVFAGQCVTLFLNVLACLAEFTTSTDAGVDFGLSILWFILFAPCSFLCWFRPAYKAFRSVCVHTSRHCHQMHFWHSLQVSDFIRNISILF